MHWTWDPRKNLSNRRAHGLSFETAVLVFDDPLAASRPDPSAEEERWQTVGAVGPVIVFVVHTWPEPDPDGEEVGRIISARKRLSPQDCARFGEEVGRIISARKGDHA